MWMNWHGCLGTVGDYNSVPFVRDKVDLARLSGGLGSANSVIFTCCASFFLPARPRFHSGSLSLSFEGHSSIARSQGTLYLITKEGHRPRRNGGRGGVGFGPHLYHTWDG